MLINLTFLSLILFLSLCFISLTPSSLLIDPYRHLDQLAAHRGMKKNDSNKQLLRQTRCLILMMRRRRRDGLG